MAKIIDFPPGPGAERAIGFERTEAFYEASKEFSDCIGTLPITMDQGTMLIDLVLNLLHEASHGAYLQGFEMGELEAFSTDENGEDMGNIPLRLVDPEASCCDSCKFMDECPPQYQAEHSDYCESWEK